MSYSYLEFISYCEERSSTLRMEKEIVWYNQIPIPSLLVKTIFYKADEFLELYFSHLLTALTLALSELSSRSEADSFHSYPDPSYLKMNRNHMESNWAEVQNLDLFKDIESQLSVLLLSRSAVLTLNNYMSCLNHKGKKYERLFIPTILREQIDKRAPKTRNYLKGSNGDFFGNIIAEKLNIYKAGFSDAFSGLFNKYLEFKLELYSHIDPRIANQGQTANKRIGKIGMLKPVEYCEGNYWDPILGQGGNIDAEIDFNHEFHGISDGSKISLLLLALSHEEMLTFSDVKKYTIEEFRYRVSKRLIEYSLTFTNDKNTE